MHELSIALSLLDIALDAAGRRGLRGLRVAAVHLRVGALSGVEPEALVAVWGLASDDTPMAGARLLIERTPAVGYCDRCECEAAVESIQLLCCPRCGTPTGRIVGGRELDVTALEVEA